MNPNELADKWQTWNANAWDTSAFKVGLALSFVQDCVEVLGGGFHPDTRFYDYVETETGNQVFNRIQSEHLDVAMAMAFRYLGDSIYLFALDMIHDLDSEVRA